jgi:hypothetical protein
VPVGSLQRRVPVARAIALLAVCGALLAFASMSVLHADRSSASCLGNACLPVGTYTLDTSFNCGQIVWEACYANGTTNSGNAVWHHFGWGSSSYTGTGNIGVAVTATGNGLSFGGWGVNLIRACYYDSCVAQTATNMIFYVNQNSGVAHTIWGHAKA